MSRLHVKIQIFSLFRRTVSPCRPWPPALCRTWPPAQSRNLPGSPGHWALWPLACVWGMLTCPILFFSGPGNLEGGQGRGGCWSRKGQLWGVVSFTKIVPEVGGRPHGATLCCLLLASSSKDSVGRWPCSACTLHTLVKWLIQANVCPGVMARP